MPLSIRLTQEEEARLDALAARTGRPKTFYVRQAIRAHLDELEELYQDHEADGDELAVRLSRESLERTDRVSSALSSAGRSPGTAGLVYLAPYVSPAVRERLSRAGVSYADGTGWVRIVSDRPMLAITAQGASKATRPVGSPAWTAAETLGLVEADPPSANVIILAPQDLAILDSPDIRAGLPVAPLPVVLADLLTLPGRYPAQAAALMDALAKAEPEWRP
ncbi:MAG: TraY domain-containing protein [Bifidobacteriaceae bacterium]|jgi:RHH-type rel operon transcriptional repressor/antitoxin RelB|nr:TraY domain-containing protein [Bifidobacteriaceae bacterium]